MNGYNALWQVYEDLRTQIHQTQEILNRLYLRADSIEQLLLTQYTRPNISPSRPIIRTRNGVRNHTDIPSPSITPTTNLSSSAGTQEPETDGFSNLSSSTINISIPRAGNNTSNSSNIEVLHTGSNMLENIVTTILESYMAELENSQSEQGLAPDDITNNIITSEYKDILNPINTTCPVTMEPFDPSTQVMRIISCGHIFSEAGITPWLNMRQHCPVCRSAIRPSVH